MKNRYFLFNLSSSPKQLFFGISILCYLLAFCFYIVNPDDPGVTLDFGKYSQGEASVFLIVVGTLLIPLYYLLARIFKSKYIADPEKESDDEWLK